MLADPAFLLTYLLASFFIIVVPGPTVSVIVANALRSGTQAGLLNVAGTQAGLLLMVFIVALSLESIVSMLSYAFEALKLIGALYLVWLGIRLLRSDGSFSTTGPASARSRSGYFWQGFLVIWANPKAFLFLGAFIPQFIDTQGNTFTQIMWLGLLFMCVGALFDSAYALLAGRAGRALTKTRVRTVELLSGVCLVIGGVWLATLQTP